MFFAVRSWAALVLACTLVSSPSPAQTTSGRPGSSVVYPSPLARREGPAPPSVAFRLVDRIALPGPLSGEPPRWDDGRLLVPVSGGMVVVRPGDGVDVRPGRDDRGDDRANSGGRPWVVSEDGLARYRTLPRGRVIAERRERPGDRWKRAWSLRVAGATLAPPLLSGPRLLFGSLDNQLYAVRARNGHRLWAVDLGERISRPLALWEGTLPVREGGERKVIQARFVLVVPDGGGRLVAIDPHDGRSVATVELPDRDEWLAAPAVPLPDHSIALARQGFESSEAAVLVYALEAAPADEVPYNEASAPQGARSGDPPPTSK